MRPAKIIIYCCWNNGIVLVQRGAINIKTLPQEMFDFFIGIILLFKEFYTTDPSKT